MIQLANHPDEQQLLERLRAAYNTPAGYDLAGLRAAVEAAPMQLLYFWHCFGRDVNGFPDGALDADDSSILTAIEREVSIRSIVNTSAHDARNTLLLCIDPDDLDILRAALDRETARTGGGREGVLRAIRSRIKALA